MASSNGLAGLLCFALMAVAATATQFRVGGAKGWSVPDGTAESYNAWASRMRFIIGDQLLFVYPKDTDSVLLVDHAAYDACNTTTYVTKFEGGSTVFTFDRSGPFFFISGNVASCMASQKLVIVVLSADHTPPGLLPTPPSSMPPTSAPPAPSPSSSPPSPPSMVPPSAAPVPSPSSPPSMAPPSGTPMPSPMSPPSGAPMPTPESAPSPTGSAPGAAPAGTPGSSPSSSPGTPGSPPSPGTPGSPPSPGTPGGAPQPPADSTSPPAPGADSTTPGSGATPLNAGLIGTIAAGIGYAILAI